MSETIELKDVRVGDLVEGTYAGSIYAPSESATYRGVVTSVKPGEVRTNSFTFRKDYYPTLTLIEHHVEPTKIGTLVKMGNGRTAIRTPLTNEFRASGDQSLSPWLYFPAKGSDSWATGNQPEWLTWGEVLGKFGQGVVEIIKP